MPERIFIAVAWPYANSSLHLGHVAGCYLPADIFARYHRLKGDDVLMVSGSDWHGTPVTVRADEEGKTPREIVERYQAEFEDSWRRLGISWDLFTHTGTANHAATTHEIFNRLLDEGYVYKATMSMPYSVVDQRFLPDRYVTGTCPHCGSEAARGDQCDGCGRQLDAKDLIGIRSAISGDTPEFRDTEHFFLKLSAFQEQLEAWVGAQEHWRPNVRNFTLGYLREGLQDRAVTRDLTWGVSIPLDGYDSKRIYVWFEAVIGYLSAAKQWAQDRGEPEAWRPFWEDGARAYYFMAKDNIPFHTIIWPAMLMGFGGLALPYDVAANEYLNLQGLKFSKSRNWAVWLPDFLDRFDPDPLRYVLSAIMPESSDADFRWQEFVRRNNDELVATYGNFVNRVLSFTHRAFDGRIPDPGDAAAFDEPTRELIAAADGVLERVDALLGATKFKAAINAAMGLAHHGNRYLEEQSPWKTVKTDRQAAATALWAGCYAIAALKTVLCPFMPHSSQRVHEYLGLSGAVEDAGWVLQPPPPGAPFERPKPLFEKLDEAEVAKEMSAAGAGPDA